MKNILMIVALMCFALISGEANGQTQVKVLYSSPSLDSLLSTNLRVNHNQASLDGYRIQIYSGSGAQAKSEAMAKRNKVLELFPYEDVYVVYNAPFWRVRVGNYRFRSEALPLLSKIKPMFPGSYTVRDNTIKKALVK